MANKKNDGVSPVTAGLVGAAVGAVAGFAAAELTVKENREALGEKIEEIKEGVSSMVGEKVEDAKDEIKKKTQ